MNTRSVICEVLATDRLYLRQIHMQDLSFLTKLHQDPAVMKYLGPPRSRSQIAARIDNIITGYTESPGYGIWMLCKSHNSSPLGWACLKDLDGSVAKEIGYRIDSKHWNKGYATEIGCALLDFGFQHMELEQISGVSRPDNMASVSVLRKCGMTQYGMGRFYNHEMVHFKIARTHWQSQRVEDQSS